MKKINYGYFERVLDTTAVAGPRSAVLEYKNCVGTFRVENGVNSGASLVVKINGVKRVLAPNFPYAFFEFQIPSDCVMDIFIELEVIAGGGTTSNVQISFLTI